MNCTIIPEAKAAEGILPAPEDLTQNLAAEQGAAH